MLNLPFKNVLLVKRILDKIKTFDKPIRIMEVCGSHTMAIHKDGLDSVLPSNIKFISGPGCPVCVTSENFIDDLITLSHNNDFIIASFGDLARVPGILGNLQEASAEGGNIKYIYSPSEVIKIAEENKDKKIVFPAIGFETTAPLTAMLLLEAKNKNIENIFILNALKTMPRAIELMAEDKDACIDAFLLPGHVSSVIGATVYNFLPDKYKKNAVVSGFEPLDIIYSVFMIAMQIKKGECRVENQYSRCVTEQGNLTAQKIVSDFFEPSSSDWRGLGTIENSGLSLRSEFKKFDASQFLPEGQIQKNRQTPCICGEILKGIKTPVDCPLFAEECQPDNPIGACMVSQEGACNVWFKYK